LAIAEQEKERKEHLVFTLDFKIARYDTVASLEEMLNDTPRIRLPKCRKTSMATILKNQ
jgi:hypothetical protein